MKKFLILLLFAGVFAGCKDDTIAPDDKEKDQPETTEMTDFQIADLCYKMHKNYPPFYIITNDSAYQAVFDGRECKPRIEIDFSKRTLIGKVVCSVSYPDLLFKGERDDSAKTYNIVVQLKEKHGDPVLVCRMNWFTIPKIKDGYSIKMTEEKLGYTTHEPSTYEIIPSGTTKNLYSVEFGDSLTGYAAGGGGTILKTSNGGISWNELSSGTTVALRGISAVLPAIAYACGDNGTILKTTNGGSTWTSQSSGTNIQLNSLYFIDEQNGFAVGGDVVNNSTRGIVLKTTNGGVTWTQYSSQQNLPLLYSVFMRTASIGIAVGQNSVNGVANSMNILRTFNGGISWEVVNSGSSSTFFDVCFMDSATARYKEPLREKGYGWICGENGAILETTDAGQTWKQKNSKTSENLFCIVNANASERDLIYATSESGKLVRSVDLSESWFPELTGTSQTLYDAAHIKTKYRHSFPHSNGIAVVQKEQL